MNPNRAYNSSELRDLFTGYLSRGAIAEGVEFFRGVATRNPEFGLAWHLLARLYEAEGNDEGAYHCYYQGALASERSTRLATAAKVNIFGSLVRFCLKRRWVERAKRHLEEMQLLAPNSPAVQSLEKDLTTTSPTDAPMMYRKEVATKGVLQPSQRQEATRQKSGMPATTQLSPHHTEAAETQVASLMSQAHQAFTKGLLHEAESLYLQVIALAPTHSSAYVSLAQTYNRLNDIFRMEKVILDALDRPTDNEIAVLQTLAQVNMKKGLYERVIQIHQSIIGKARSDSQKVGSFQWIGKSYSRLGNYLEARTAYMAALELAPTNNYIRSALRAVELQLASGSLPIASATPSTNDLGLADEDDIAAWSDEEEGAIETGPSSISYMLELDAARHAWQHPTILARGGLVHLEDARQLMQDAVTAQEAFGNKAIRFLEAAKAFGALEESERDPNQHQEALQRYAGQQGGHYLLQLVGEIKRHGQARTLRSKALRDAACSYYVEAMKILQYRKPSMMFLIMQKYLQALLLVELSPTEAMQRFGSLEGTWKLDAILEQAASDPVGDVLETVARGLLELGRAQMGLVRSLYGLDEVRRTISRHREQWREVLEKLGAPGPRRRIPDAMRALILIWKDAERAARDKFSDAYNYPVTLDNIVDMRSALEELLKFDGVFLESDRELLREIIDTVLSLLSRYGELPRSTAERDVMADKAWQNIKQLRQKINAYPTYWGRVNFDALLYKWERMLGKAEQARLAELRPELTVQLESKRLPLHESAHVLIFSVRNQGQATALDTTFSLVEGNSQYIGGEEFISLGNIPPGTIIPAKVTLQLLPLSDEAKFLSIKYKVSFRSADKEVSLPTIEDTVHFGDFSRIEPNPFNEAPPVTDDRMFKGRDELVDWIIHKLHSEEHVRSTLLYGLTRTGKTSILIQLQKRIWPSETLRGSETYFLMPLLISFDRCARDSASDFYEAVFQVVAEQLDELHQTVERNQTIPAIDAAALPKTMTGFEHIVRELYRAKFFPVFLIDEFTIYRQMFDKRVLDGAFLSRLRYFAVNEQIASFVYAGTYDLKALTSDPAYGITGQFATTDERQVGRIGDAAAQELVRVIQDKLLFSDTAVDNILFLSGRIPYFIQLICKNCVYYANHRETSTITPIELEAVISHLTLREDQVDKGSPITPISAGTFSANIWSRSDPLLTTATLAALAFHPHAGRRDEHLTMDQIAGSFSSRRINIPRKDLLIALEDLFNKQVIDIKQSTAGTTEYRIAVDIFRRWFVRNHSIEWAIGRLQGEFEASVQDTSYDGGEKASGAKSQ